MSLRKSPAVTKAISDSRDADESRRRVAKPLAAASGTSSKVTGAAVILLLVVGLVYLTSSSAEPSWSDAHGFVRAADDTSHILPNFQPIHEECKCTPAARTCVSGANNAHTNTAAFYPFFLSLLIAGMHPNRQRLDCGLVPQGFCWLRRLYHS
jgi:hypothetical protein